MKESRTIMIVAGEASGDTHAAKLVNALCEAEPDTKMTFFGSAGPKMRAAGVEATVVADELSVVGLAEIGCVLPMFLRAFRALTRAAVERKPDVVVLVDFPDFNLKLAKSLKKKGFVVVYYISPQIWAWRKYRISVIRKYVDLMIAILPFEKDWYETNDVSHVEYVGSPLAMEVHANVSKVDFCRKHDLIADRPIVALLPGSRRKEIVRILPVMLDAAAKMSEKSFETQFIIPLATNQYDVDVEQAIIAARLRGIKMPGTLRILENETYDALNASDAAAVTSGTATLEAGMIGTPMAIVYKSSALNYLLLKPLISVAHYGLINLIAGKRIANELIQGDFTATTLSSELLRLLEPAANTEMRASLKAAADTLGHGGASKRAAEAIIKLIDSKIRTAC